MALSKAASRKLKRALREAQAERITGTARYETIMATPSAHTSRGRAEGCVPRAKTC